MKENINWGIIGCGDVTELKSGPAFNKIEGSKLVAVMRRDAKLAANYAARHSVPKWYANGDDLINDPEVNAIYIATPPSTHSYYAIRAMQAGKPVYVEKPMAATYTQCLEMINVSNGTGVPLFVAYYRRSLPGFIKVKELVDEGIIGKTIMVNIKLIRPPLPAEKDFTKPIWRVDPKIAGGGIFYDLASHQLDFLDYVFGPVTEVGGIAENSAGLYSAEDCVTAILRFKSGVIASGAWCFVADEGNSKDEIEIIGSKGRILFSTFGHQPVKLITENKIIELPYINPVNIQFNLIKQIVETIQGKSECNSTGITAARTNRVMEDILKGFYP